MSGIVLGTLWVSIHWYLIILILQIETRRQNLGTLSKGKWLKSSQAGFKHR